MKIAMIGTGAYGLALALMLSKKEDVSITMWSENPRVVDEFNSTGKLSSIINNVDVPSSINITTSYEEAMKDAEMLFITSAAKYVEEICIDIKPFYKSNIPICIASKGIEEHSLMLLSSVVKDILNTNKITTISGPTFAVDLARNEPSALAIAGMDKKALNKVKKTLENDTLKLRESNDLLGIQICGSIKNIIAIASGIVKGLGYTESTQAFLINESIHDIKYLIKCLGGNPKTILSFAGIGDLLLTCTSTKSRNFSFGYVIGSTKDKEKINEFLKNNTVEGYYTLEAMYRLIKKNKIKLPIIDLIYDIVMNDVDASKLAEFLIEKA